MQKQTFFHGFRLGQQVRPRRLQGLPESIRSPERLSRHEKNYLFVLQIIRYDPETIQESPCNIVGNPKGPNPKNLAIEKNSVFL